jgi:small-conductance mechanosensitive channel/CRP-like cAMP-binding protein
VVPHPSAHLTLTIVLVGIVPILMVAVRNPAIRRRFLFTLSVLATSAIVHGLLVWLPDAPLLQEHGWKVEAVLLTLACTQALVALAFNPWSGTTRPERAPAIVQDAIIAFLVSVAAVFTFRNTEVLTTSAIVAAVMGFALQETLGNAFAGLAIQIEKPFRVGHWITVGSHEGTVREITWRATKIWTKSGNMVILPNSLVAREPINNYSEPIAPTRLHIDVGVGYEVPPNTAREALVAALRNVPRVLNDPPAEALLWNFDPSTLLFRVHFWVDDYSTEEIARDEVRRAIYYELGRRKIEIPWPIQIEYSREEPAPEPDARRIERFSGVIGGVPVFAQLSEEGRRALASGAAERLFGDGDTIVREGAPGASMFVVCRGEVAVTIGPGTEVARIGTGGFFGEMSLLTGEPRSATVAARGDAVVLEIPAEAFKTYVINHPDVIDDVAGAAAARRRELDHSRGLATSAAGDVRVTLAARMRRFFGLA